MGWGFFSFFLFLLFGLDGGGILAERQVDVGGEDHVDRHNRGGGAVEGVVCVERKKEEKRKDKKRKEKKRKEN